MTKRRLIAVFAIFMLLMASQVASSQSETPVLCPRANDACPKGADACYYKFTVLKVVDEKTLEVKYPSSVFTVTTMKYLPDDEKAKEDDYAKKEADYTKEVDDYAKKNKDKKFTIHVKAGKTPEKNKTYLLVRCPDPDYEIKAEIDESDEK